MKRFCCRLQALANGRWRLCLGLVVLSFILSASRLAQAAPAPSPAPGSGDDRTAPFNVSDVNLLPLVTNLARLAGQLGIECQVDNLRLNLNGFALVGFNNSLTNLSAQQFLPRSPVEPDDPIRADAAGACKAEKTSWRALLNHHVFLSNACSLSVNTNIAVVAAKDFLRLTVGTLELDLNGFALVGLTNSLADLHSRQTFIGSEGGGTRDGRSPLSTAPVTITEPGSYYLTGSVRGVASANGITILTNDVTLDLNGFALIGAAHSLHGIAVPGAHTNVVVRNGFIRAWGQSGVAGAPASGLRLERLCATHNAASGLVVGSHSAVLDCSALANGAAGIIAARGSLVRGCRSSLNSGDGIRAGDDSLIEGCMVLDNGAGSVSGPADMLHTTR